MVSRSLTLILVAVALVGLGGQCNQSQGLIKIALPIEDQLNEVAGGIQDLSVVAIRILIPAETTNLNVTLDGGDITGFLTITGHVAEANLFSAGQGNHELEATGIVDGVPSVTLRNFEVVKLENSAECEILNNAHCMYPYPSNHFTVPDVTTDTGLRLSIPAGAPPQPTGDPIDTAFYNELDGFSPTAQILMHFPAGVDLALSDAPRLLDPECCGQPAGPPWIDTRTYTDRSLEVDLMGDPDSPTLLIDTVTGELVRHFAEVDGRTADLSRQSLILRPGESLVPNRRYIVAVRNLVDAAGDPVEAEPPFAVLRDERWTTIASLAAKYGHYESEIFPQLAAAGVPRENLVLAFDFTTQSEDQLTHQMLSMRDQAYVWLSDREMELIPGDAGTETFTVDTVTDFDCNVAGTVLRRIVEGTFESPLFLDGDLDAGSVQFMNVDANDIPVQNLVTPTHNAQYTIGIPCTLEDADPNNDPARPLILGHGLFGTGKSMVDGIPDLIGAAGLPFSYIAGATDWRGMSSVDLAWLGTQILGIGNHQLNNFAGFPDRLRQGMLNTLVLARMMKNGFFNNNAAFQLGGNGVFPGAAEEEYYYGISLGGVMGLFFSALTPDIERFGIDVPSMNFSILLQRSTQFIAFEQILNGVGLTDPIDRILGIGLFHELWVSAEPAGYARHITADPLPGSGGPSKILMTAAWLDKQVSNQATEITARTLGIPNLTGSIAQGFQGIPDVDTDIEGPQDSALVIWDTGSFDILDPAQDPVIPPLSNEIPSGVCDPHGFRPAIPASMEQLIDFLQPGGQITNTCEGVGKLCDAGSPVELSLGFDTLTPPHPCNPYVP
jgi:hypothetical protein